VTDQPKSGIPTALGMAMAAHEPEPEAEQLDLLGLPEPKTLEGRELVAQRAAGRPLGSRNKRTIREVNWLLSVYQDPRAVLLAIAQAPVDELAARLGCTAMEALQEKRLAAIGVLPYVAQKQPLAVDLTNHKVVHLHIDSDFGGSDGSDDGVGLSLRVVDGTAEIVSIEDASKEGAGDETNEEGKKP
jgi:hypothetical protein